MIEKIKVCPIKGEREKCLDDKKKEWLRGLIKTETKDCLRLFEIELPLKLKIKNVSINCLNGNDYSFCVQAGYMFLTYSCPVEVANKMISHTFIVAEINNGTEIEIDPKIIEYVTTVVQGGFSYLFFHKKI